MGLAQSGERLDNLVHAQQLAERLRNILCPLVTVERQRLRGISASESLAGNKQSKGRSQNEYNLIKSLCRSDSTAVFLFMREILQ